MVGGKIQMKIAIDLNDVLRAYTSQFASYYKKVIDRKFDIDNVDIWTNDLTQVFPFESKKQYLNFLYEDCPFEIFGAVSPMEKNLPMRLDDWMKELENLDEIPEICTVATKEYDKSIGSTLHFLSKIATKIREHHILLGEQEVWDKCDVLITANPNLLVEIPEGKTVVKIKATYNEEIESEYEFESLMQFLNDDEIIEKITIKK